jgi:hypothetical protein
VRRNELRDHCPLDAAHSQARRAPVGCRAAWSLTRRAGSDRVGTRPEPCLFRPVRPHRNTGAQPSDDVRTTTGIVVSRRARGSSPVFEGTARAAGEHPSCIPHLLSPSWEFLLLRPPASLHPPTPCLNSSSWAPARAQACRTSRASPRRRASRCAAHACQPSLLKASATYVQAYASPCAHPDGRSAVETRRVSCE